MKIKCLVDPKNYELSSKLELVAGAVGFEPTTPNLGGWCSIRAANERTLDPHNFGGHYNVGGYPS